MRSVLQDLHHSFRQLAKAPGFFALAGLTLALGIGANTAIFSVINSVLLRPLPFDEPDRLVRLFETEAAPGNYPFAGPDYLDWQQQNQTFEGMSLFSWYRRCNVSGVGEPQSAQGIETEANFFSVLGVRPLLGRTFAPGEDQGGRGRVVILSYGFWQRFFAGDDEVVGKSIVLNSETHTVIGVMPAWFNYPQRTELWTPLDMSPRNLGPRGSHSYLALGRLKHGVTVTRAQADLAAIAKRLEQQYPDTNEKIGAAVVSMHQQLTRPSREPLLILLGAVALVLLVACANVANLLLIRAGGRRREIAIRSALGASRWRIIRQLLTESLVLSCAGAAVGLVAALWGVDLLRSVRTLPIPLVNPVRVDTTVLVFTAAAAVLTGMLFGIAPALQSSGTLVSEELKSSAPAVLGPGGRRRRLRDAIVVAEIAVSLALLVGAGLLLRTFDNMRHTEIGVDSQNILTMGLSLPEARYATLAAQRAFFERLLDRLHASPGVRAASISTLIPLEGGSNGYITVPGQDNAPFKNQLFEWNYVTRDYLTVFGIPLLQGRSFTAQDEQQAADVALKINEVFSLPNPPNVAEALRDSSWVAIVTRSMARIVWPDQDPIGRTFLLGGGLQVRVIGVAGDVKVRGLRQAVAPQAYFPLTGALGEAGRRELVVKTDVPPRTLVQPIRREVASLDSTLAVINPRTMEDVISDGMQDTALQTWLLTVFAALAALVASVGLYSVMAFLVAQRRHELGLRIALGAERSDVIRFVLGHAVKLIGVGVVAGIGAALWLTRLMQGLLFGVAAGDPSTVAAVSLLLTLVALGACWVPARRAMRVDPLVALRHE